MFRALGTKSLSHSRGTQSLGLNRVLRNGPRHGWATTPPRNTHKPATPAQTQFAGSRWRNSRSERRSGVLASCLPRGQLILHSPAHIDGNFNVAHSTCLTCHASFSSCGSCRCPSDHCSGETHQRKKLGGRACIYGGCRTNQDREPPPFESPIQNSGALATKTATSNVHHPIASSLFGRQRRCRREG